MNQNKIPKLKWEKKIGIFFKIDKIEIICFKPGICFLTIKTFLDESATIDDVLKFNNKFKKINKPEQNEKVNIQSDQYKEKNELSTIIKSITGNNLDDEEFYTYSYICLDGEEWNSNNVPDFSKMISEYIESKNIQKEIEIIDILDYIKLGTSKNSTTLITNSLEAYNYTKLPFEYESKYLYTLIYAYYQKNKLIEFEKELDQNKNIKKELMEFINKQCIKEITKEKLGSKLYKKWKNEFEFDKNYLNIINKYEIVYKNEKTKKRKRNTKIMWVIIIICIIINIINVITLLNLPK